MKSTIYLLSIVILALIFACDSGARKASKPEVHDEQYLKISHDILTDMILVKGEVVYVPVYSEIFHTDMKRKVKLSATLSIRNTSMDSEIVVSKVDYFDTHGKLLRKYLESPLKLKPLQTINYVVEYKEAEGGIGANFIVEWAAEREVPEPLIETVMIGGSSSLGISFVCEGKVIQYINQ